MTSSGFIDLRTLPKPTNEHNLSSNELEFLHGFLATRWFTGEHDGPGYVLKNLSVCPHELSRAATMVREYAFDATQERMRRLRRDYPQFWTDAMDASRSFQPQPCEMLVTRAAIAVNPDEVPATARRDHSISRTGPLIVIPYTRVSIAHREHGTLSTGLSDRPGTGGVCTSPREKGELEKRL